MEWTVVTALGIIVGLFLSVGAPIIKLNSNIVKLNVSLDSLNKRTDKQEHDLEEQKRAAHESHKQLWLYNQEQDKRLDDHEHRITALERDS